MVALSGTLLVVYQICAAEHDTFLFSEGDTRIFPKWVTYRFLNNAFLDQFMVFCVAFCGLMVWHLLNIKNLVCVRRACVLLQHQVMRKWRAFLLGPSLAGVKTIWWASWGRVIHPCWPEDGWIGVGVGVILNSWPLGFSVEHFATASAHPFPRIIAWALT
jgi:hypothetical protein